MPVQSDLQLLALTSTAQVSETQKTDTKCDNPSTDDQAPPPNLPVSNKIGNSYHADQATISKAATLEQRYIELLEKRIASLEEAQENQNSKGSEYKPDKKQDKDEEEEANGDNNKHIPDKQSEDTKEQRCNKNTDVNKVDSTEVTALVEDNAACDKADQEKAQESSRVRFTETRYDEHGYFKTTDADKGPPADQIEKKTNYAFVWSRVFDKENRYSSTDVEIQSEDLGDLLKINLSHDPWFPLHDKVIRFQSPFKALVHNWSKLLNVVDPCSGDNDKQSTAKKDLKQLMKQISTTNELTQYFQDFDPANMPKTVSFNLLWTIFPPGCLVCSTPVMQKDQVFILQACDTYEDEDSKTRFSLTCWAYDWNGETFNRVPYEFYIDSFSGTKAINTLDHYPLEHHRDVKEISARLVKRGTKYRDLCISKSGSQLFDYNGFSIEDQKGITRQELSSRKFSDRQVIIDFFSYNQYVAGGGRMGFKQPAEPYMFCSCAICFENDALKKTTRYCYDGIDKNEEFTEEQYLICPPRVLGFFMVRKTWAQLLVDDVGYLKKNIGDAFKKLVLEEKQKSLIRSLVSEHGEESEDGEGGSQHVEDIIEGKGKGVVILLHGPPGVGKSLTAESVAQDTNKPLFAVSVADIGLTPTEVEVNLSQLFNLASLWKAVLLFDEADVFLEARNKSDMERNALVSVLLRVMEYYEGILILTTNRIKTFDLAVQSRVHLAIRYQDLSAVDRKKILKNFSSQLTRENCSDLRAIENYIDDFDEDLNGRQIRNVFSSAMALARDRKEKVCVKDFRQVVKVIREFQKYLVEQSFKARQQVE
ncbi:MAG: hypothetical protein Q9217_004725 [Psora testacea]